MYFLELFIRLYIYIYMIFEAFYIYLCPGKLFLVRFGPGPAYLCQFSTSFVNLALSFVN